MYNELIEQINNECLTFGGYDYFLMKEIYTQFCRKHRIRPNTPNWIYIVDLLWCDLDVSIRTDFDNIDDFDAWLKDYFV